MRVNLEEMLKVSIFDASLCISLILQPHLSGAIVLTHLPLVLHIYASANRVNIRSDNGLSPIRRQAII